MQKKLIIIAFWMVACVSCQGNIVRCLSEIGKTVKDITLLIDSIYSKDPFSIIDSIRQTSFKIQPMTQECSNPICLTEAKKRCQDRTGKSCEQYGAIMYPKCEYGFYNSGCCLCLSYCPPGFRDDGFFCAKPTAYGRGAGYPWKFGDSFNLNNALQRCNKDNSQGCEQNGLVIYPKCAPGFHNVGCCICSPDCPSNTTDIGVSCTKPTYGRGVGFPIHYDDCQTKKQLRSSNVDYSYMNISQLKDTIVELSQEFIENRSNENYAVEVASELSRATTAYEILMNKSSK